MFSFLSSEKKNAGPQMESMYKNKSFKSESTIAQEITNPLALKKMKSSTGGDHSKVDKPLFFAGQEVQA